MYGLPTVEHEKLQRVQNIAARLITGRSRRDHITPVLKNLHWLSVKLRITFKISLLTYKILNGQSPSYLTSLISSYKPVRSLRSSDHLLLKVPNVNTGTYGQRTFSYCAPKLWNGLPKSLKESETVTIFKKKLKTFLFRDYITPLDSDTILSTYFFRYLRLYKCLRVLASRCKRNEFFRVLNN